MSSYSKKRAFGTGVRADLSSMSTAALMKKARTYEAVRRNRAPRIRGAIAPYGGRRELKYVDTALSQNMVVGTDDITCLNLLALGDDNTSRDGRQVTIKSVQIKARAIVGPGAAANAQVGRAMLIWDNAVNGGALPSATAILTADSDIGFPVVDQSNRFTILWDSKYAFGPNIQTATQAQADNTCYGVEVYKELNHVAQYVGTTAVIGAIQNGGLYLLTTGSGAGVVLTGNARVRFTDD